MLDNYFDFNKIIIFLDLYLVKFLNILAKIFFRLINMHILVCIYI